MPLTITFAASMPADTDLIAIGVREDHLDEDTADVDSRLLEAQGFVGRLDQTALVSNGGEQVGLLVGLGPAAAIDPAALRRAGAALARASARHAKAATTLLASIPAGLATAGAEALAEGVVLGAYRYGRFKDADPAVDRLVEVTIVGRGGQRVRDATAKGVRIAEAVSLARDLVNTPGGTLTAPVFAEQAAEVARAARTVGDSDGP